MTDISQPPLHWGRDSITSFLDTIRNNQFATFERKRPQLAILSEIDRCFEEASKDLFNPKDPVVPLLLFRGIGSYKTACGTAMAGQSAETFTLLRMSVEAAGYAYFIHKRPELSEIWLKRATDKAAVRKYFNNGAVVSSIRSVDARLGDIYLDLYERAIDFGAHPNEMAITGSLAILEEPDRRHFKLKLLDDDGLAISHALKSTAQAGLCALFLFQHVYPARFEILGLKHRLQRLRAHL